MPQVLMTGYGAVTPFGHGVATLWAGLLANRSGVRPLANAWTSAPGGAQSQAQAVGSVDLDLVAPLGRVRARQLDRNQQLALVAAREAWADAGEPDVEPERLAVVVGTGIGGVQTLLAQNDVLVQRGSRQVSPRAVPMLMSNGAAGQISIEYGARAGSFTTSSACASGAEALALAARLITLGDADVVIAGGVEAAINPLTLAAFARAGALAPPLRPADELSRPFDNDRKGFVLGEGAGFVVLERDDHARARGIRARAHLAGSGITSDAHHITAAAPDGRGQMHAIQLALTSAGLAADDIDHVNAHATGTTIGDRAEAVAIRATLGHSPAITAPKGSLGHLVGGAGAVEAIIVARTLETGLIPPTRNLDELDPEIPLDVVTDTPRQTTVRAALTNSFGFGGQNVTLALTKA